MFPCPVCEGTPILCEPNYADEGGTMVVCEDCDFAGDSFVLGEHCEGSAKAIEFWNALPRGKVFTWDGIMRSTGYLAIQSFYGDACAKRAGVPFMNHINEGIEILRRIDADMTTMEAFATHPLFQFDTDLMVNLPVVPSLDPMVAFLTMEYRRTANDFLSNKVIREESPARVWDDELKDYVHPKSPFIIKALHEIELSPVKAVNEMLIADKVQNRKDFEIYHKATHARSLELDYYFKYWLRALDISEERYQELIKRL